LLSALSDDTQAVVVEVSEAVGTALDEFHLSLEALGDAVVFGKAPHGDQGLLPSVEGRGQAHEGFGPFFPFWPCERVRTQKDSKRPIFRELLATCWHQIYPDSLLPGRTLVASQVANFTAYRVTSRYEP